MAMTADGKIATANRMANTFGTARDHDHLLVLRATSDAVLCGARTVESGDVNLGPGAQRFRRRRLRRGLREYNLRLIASGQGSLSPGAGIFRHQFSPIVVFVTQGAAPSRIARLAEVANEVKAFGKRTIDWPAALSWLKRAYQVNRLVCEGGGELNRALLRARVVNEFHLTVCPCLAGGRSAPTIADGPRVEGLDQTLNLRLKSREREGDELFLVYTLEYSSRLG
jgi:riboflavin-specific deaminase-like protein